MMKAIKNVRQSIRVNRILREISDIQKTSWQISTQWGSKDYSQPWTIKLIL
jgi:hypothetical protein